MASLEEAEIVLAAVGFAEREGIWIAADEELGAVPTAGGVFVGWLDVAWPGPAQPVWKLEGVVHLPLALADDGLDEALRRARSRRERALKQCRLCRLRFIPGHMDEPDVYQDCSERESGTVH